MEKCNKNAWISKYDYKKNEKKLDFYVPIQKAMRVEIYPVMLSDVLGR